MDRTLAERVREGVEAHKARDFVGAERLFRAILADAPDHADAHHMLGLALFERQDLQASQAEIETALALRPQVAEFHHNLAVVVSVRGEERRAEGHLREAIRLKPDYTEAFYNMSSIVRLRHPDPLTGQVDALLAREGLGCEDRVFLHFAAGKWHDDLKAYDRAFAHYAAGNAAKGVHYDPGATEAQLRDIRQVFTREFIAARNAQAVESGGKAVFIVGMPRSGTSLTEQILASHSRVHGAGELGDINAIAGTLAQHAPPGAAYPQSAARVRPEVFQGLARHYLKRLAELGGDADRVVNKMPLDCWHLGLICCLFRDPVILHCRREPLDTCLSCFFQNFKPGHGFSFSLEGLGHYHRMYRAIMAHWAEVLPVRVIDVCYEDIVAQTEGEARRLLSEIGLDWEPACAEPHRNTRAVKTASKSQVRQPVYASSAKRWQRYAAHLGPLRAALEG